MKKPFLSRSFNLRALVFTFTLLVGAYGCADKLENVQDITTVKAQSFEVQSFKNWCSKKFSASNATVTTRSTASTARSLKLDWNQITKLNQANGLRELWVMPINDASSPSSSNGTATAKRYLIFSRSESVEGYIAEVYAKNTVNLDKLLEGVLEDVLWPSGRVNNTFEGTVVLYDIEYKYLLGKDYVLGKVPALGAKIVRATSAPAVKTSSANIGAKTQGVYYPNDDGSCGDGCTKFTLVNTYTSGTDYCDCPEPESGGTGGSGGGYSGGGGYGGGGDGGGAYGGGSSGGGGGGYGPGEGGYNPNGPDYGGGPHGPNDGGGGPTVPDPGYGGGGATVMPKTSFVGNYIMTLQDQTDFPRFTEVVRGLSDRVSNDPELMASLVKYTGLSEQQILDGLKFGNGPTIVITSLTDGYGMFNRKEPNIVNIDSQIPVAFEIEPKQNISAYKGLEFLLAITTLHEFVHYGDFATSTYFPKVKEMGTAWETAIFGVRVDVNNAFLVYLQMLSR